MSNKTTIKANITASFTTNGVGDITGLVGRTQINDMVDKIYQDMFETGYIPLGKATTGTNPGSPEFKCMYLNTYSVSLETYTHFSGITVPAYQLGWFYWDLSAWHFTLYLDLSSGVTTSPYKVTKIPSQSTDLNYQLDTGVPQDKFVSMITFKWISGTPTVKCGETLGGEEFFPSTLISSGYMICKPEKILDTSSGYIYFTISGGTIDIRIDYIESF